MVSVADDFFIAVRVFGDDERILLSDVTAAEDWPLAREVLERLELPLPDEDDLDTMQPAGDLACSPTSASRPWRSRCSARTRTCTRTRCSTRSPAGSASARSSGRPWTRAGLSDTTRDRPPASPSRRRTRRRCGSRSPRPTWPAAPPATSPVGVPSVRRAGRTAASSPRPQPARGTTTTRPHTPRCWRSAPPAASSAAWRLDGCTLVVTLEPCTMCAGRGRPRAARPAGLRGVRPQGRRGRVAVGRRPGPPAQPPAGGGRRGARRRVRGAPARVVRAAPGPPVTYPAVACPSGLRSTPRKRVRGQLLRGFKSHRHRHLCLVRVGVRVCGSPTAVGCSAVGRRGRRR